MAKTKKVAFPPWQTTTPYGDEKKYVRIGSILTDEKFNALPTGAQMLWVRMLYAAGGKREFTFPHGLYKDFCTKPTFQSHLAKLIQSGFIEVAQSNANLRKPNVYRFSTAWRGVEQNAVK